MQDAGYRMQDTACRIQDAALVNNYWLLNRKFREQARS